jgi:hypothetical protein
VEDENIVSVRLHELELHRPQQWGACWLAGELHRKLGLDGFCRQRLYPSRKGTPWDLVLQTLVAYRLIDPGSEWRLHRHWYEHSAMGDLLDKPQNFFAQAFATLRMRQRAEVDLTG